MKKFWEKRLNAEKISKTKSSVLSSNEESFRIYDTQRWHPLEEPEYAL